MTLINVEKTRQLIRRFFDSSIKEILEELLQNCQRASATMVDCNLYASDRIVISDNGQGIEDFETLLVIGESKYDSDTVEAQNPMGLGFYSLLAHKEVKSVTIITHGLSLEIDTVRWWDDYDYAKSWKERIQEFPEKTTGTRIIVRATTDFIDTFLKTINSVVPGYDLVNLNVRLQSEVINNHYCHPRFEHREANPVSTFDYQGAKIYLPHNQKYFSHNSFEINHFGQIIEIKHGSFQFLLEITTGGVLDFLAPSRKGIIFNEKYEHLKEFVRDRMIEIIQEKEEPTWNQVDLFYRMATLEQANTFPWINCGYQTIPKVQIGNKVYLIEEIEVLLSGETHNFDSKSCGLETFSDVSQKDLDICLLEKPQNTKSLLTGISGVPIHKLIWRTQRNHHEIELNNQSVFCELGEYALVESDAEIDADTKWYPVTYPVYLADETQCIEYADGELPDLTLFGSKEPIEAFDEYFDLFADVNSSYYEEYYWQETRDEMRILFLKDCINRKHSYSDLIGVLELDRAVVKNINLLYQSANKATITALLTDGNTITKEIDILF